MIDKYLIEKKIRKIEEYLKELNSVKIKNIDEFTSDFLIKRFVERDIELSIEQMIDICKHIISSCDYKEPESYAECFDILYQNKILTKQAAENFKKMARFRNILIHVYDNIDDSITYGIYKKHLLDFNKFIDIIRSYLKKEP